MLKQVSFFSMTIFQV